MEEINRLLVGKQAREYLLSYTDKFDFAATLTFKYAITDRITAQIVGKQFTNRYNSAMGYNNFRKRKDPSKRALMITMLEGDGKNEHLHYHMALKKPEHMSNAEFWFLTQKCWVRTKSGGTDQNVIKPIDDENWVDYITKQIGHFSVDKIDWENTHIY